MHAYLINVSMSYIYLIGMHYVIYFVRNLFILIEITFVIIHLYSGGLY